MRHLPPLLCCVAITLLAAAPLRAEDAEPPAEVAAVEAAPAEAAAVVARIQTRMSEDLQRRIERQASRRIDHVLERELLAARAPQPPAALPEFYVRPASQSGP
jgi:hypothetical protein